MRPLFLEFPNDYLSYVVDNEFMVGKSLLVAPILEPGARARATYLPRGERWVELRSGLEVDEGWVLSEAGLDEIPLYIRGDCAVLTTVPNRRAEDPWEPLIVNAYLRNCVNTLLYDDDGETLDYIEGRRFEGILTLRLNGSVVKAGLDILNNSFKPGFKTIKLRFQKGLQADSVVIGHDSIPLERRGNWLEAELSLHELLAEASDDLTSA